MKKIYFTITVLLLGFTLTMAQTQTVYPCDDMTTNSGSSGMFPPDGELWVANWAGMQNYHQTLIKFDLSQYAGQTITNAKFKIYQHFHAPDGSPTPSKIYAITEDWDESTWPTSSNVAHGTTEYATPDFTSTLGWYEIDITALVSGWLNGTLNNNGLVIIANSGTKFAKLYSKDASDQTKHPYLEIDGITGINDINTYVGHVSVFPNPVTQSATIDFTLKSNQYVDISIFNTTGTKVIVVCNKKLVVGQYRETFTRENLKAGIYFIRIQTNNTVIVRKIIIK